LKNLENKIQNAREGKNKRCEKKNQIKIKWRNKKPVEPKRLLKVSCLENDKRRKESVLRLACNGRNQKTKGNYNEKLWRKKSKIIKKSALKKNRACCINYVEGKEHRVC